MRVLLLGLATVVFAVSGCAPDSQVSESEKAKPGENVESLPPEAMAALEQSAAMAQMSPADMIEAQKTKLVAKDVLEQSIARAKLSDKKLFVHFSADW